MILETEGYVALIQYLTEHLNIFTQQTGQNMNRTETLHSLIEEVLADKIMLLHDQHPDMSASNRLEIVREADAILYDLEEVLGSVLNVYPDERQKRFVNEFIGLVKNLFDTELQKQGV